MFKVNNKYTRTTPLAFTTLGCNNKVIEPQFLSPWKLIFCNINKRVLLRNLNQCTENPIYLVFIALHYLGKVRKVQNEF